MLSRFIPASMILRFMTLVISAAALTLPNAAVAQQQARIKDIVDFQNVRENMLIGYGLVVGLAGTGDKTRNIPFTEESMQSMLERMGINVRDTQLRTKNVAAVSITATMPAFVRTGSRIDVQVSAMGDATSLQGGILIASSLRALDGQIYAVAQGPVAISGFKAQGAASSVTRGVATTARIASGAIIEREVPFALDQSGDMKLALKNPDFTTAQRIAQAINGRYPGVALPLDPATVQLSTGQGQIMDLISGIENLNVAVEQPARIVINEASGTVVLTNDVRISPVAIAQGGLTVSIVEQPIPSQPGPFSNGETVVVPRTDISVDDGSTASLAMIDQGASLQSLIAGLNALGVSPRDLITIIQALKTSGALQAEVMVQ
ncbi:flagellar basal body P-ring protein FlgI [Sphingorhabdus sp. M41]|uniref:flagellar basal body P-ring protein FlgI n=1 Tax=Sphingorhabdus sp. M41 TaxID=1806885 RepID=UPI000B1A76F6|nr:flagellar basal body P-ring protein FlgI [Sphingorhabdus sp. M41]